MWDIIVPRTIYADARSEWEAVFTFGSVTPWNKVPDRKQDISAGNSGCKVEDFLLLPETHVEVWEISSQPNQTFLYKVEHEQLL